MNIYKILSYVFLGLTLACFITIPILGFTGNLSSGNGLVPWVYLCFAGFGIFGLLYGVFGKLARTNSFGGPKGSSQGIDSLSKPEIKVRCPECGELNDEDALYCKKCGASLKKPL
jgi:hypothetical protein